MVLHSWVDIQIKPTLLVEQHIALKKSISRGRIIILKDITVN
jgi:hypothetical protein